jgi:hypothetical protein
LAGVAGSSARRGNPPDGVADIVGDQKGAGFIDGEPDGTTARLIFIVGRP